MVSERPAKRVKLLSDDEGSSSDDGGVEIDQSSGPDFKINQAFARRFEHNQKRAERHRLEEKYGKGEPEESEDDSSTDEEEDDAAALASGALDEQFQATLKALRSKDPTIYKKDVKFYEDADEDENTGEPNGDSSKTEKPMYLMDYHRQNLLSGRAGQEEDEEDAQPTFAQEQEAIRKSVIKELHGGEGSDSDDSEDGGFLVKSRAEVEPEVNGKSSTTTTKVSARDDPDAFLDDFLSRRAWVPKTNSNMPAFESDDEDFDQRAEAFEEAYNLRFEAPDANKGKLISHARDIAAKYSVRQDPATKRQRAREVDKSKKETEKEERKADKARLKKLKLDEAEEKWRKIKETAGLKGKEFNMEEWSAFLTGDWDDQQWEKEFEKRFGDDYYAEEEDDANSEDDDADEDETDRKKKRKPRKPKFDDDIDITDLVPDYEEEERAQFRITDDEAERQDPDAMEEDNEGDEDEDEIPAVSKKSKKSKDHKKAREEAKRAARRDRRKLEALVDEKLDNDIALDNAVASGSSNKRKNADNAGVFRYRETSPTTYGLSATEILMASDAQLNSLVGLKKLATFRDADKKRRDKKRLGKKARLRQWRKETFGNESGPQRSFEDVLTEAQTQNAELK